MKRSVVTTILGLGLAAAATTTAFAQGGISIGNYQSPFNPVVWGGTSPTPGARVHSNQGVTLTLFYGQGNLVDPNLLNFSTALNWNTSSEGGGYFGYYGPVTASLPGWSSGQTWTFQVRASGNSTFGNVDTAASRSVLWTESSNINDISGNPPGLPGISANSIGLSVQVPEPSTFALAGLGGLAALMNFRRRS